MPHSLPFLTTLAATDSSQSVREKAVQTIADLLDFVWKIVLRTRQSDEEKLLSDSVTLADVTALLTSPVIFSTLMKAAEKREKSWFVK